MQALCDAEGRFTFASTRCAGPTHDATAFAITGLQTALEKKKILPEGYWIAGDEAYPCSEYLLTPWSGRDLPSDKDSFNFYHSRLRTIIECAFGMLVMRWGVFWRPLRVPLCKIPLMIGVCMKLHNFVVDERILRNFDALAGMARVEDQTVHLQDECDVENFMHKRRRDLENSTLRTILTEELSREGLKRPRRVLVSER